MEFRVDTAFVEDTAILYCHGSVSSPEALALSHAVAPLLQQRGRVVLNFAEVKAVDSGGLATLMLLQLYVRSSGGSLRYCNLKPHVNDAIERTRLNDFLDIYRNEEEATRILA